MARKTTEPGNVLGAIGLIVAAVAYGRLWFAVPPSALAVPRPVAWVLGVLGGGLLLAGLHREWTGPRRWSAIVPAVVACLGASALGLSATLKHADVTSSALPADAVKSRTVEPVACARLIGFPEDLSWALSRALAREGVLTSARPTTDAEEERTLRNSLSAQVEGPCGIALFGNAVDSDPPVEGFGTVVRPRFDRMVRISTPVGPGFDASPRDQPTLYIYGGADGWGHGQASALQGHLANTSRPATLRVFLGADRWLLVPRERPLLEPGLLPAGYAQMIARWIRTGEA